MSSFLAKDTALHNVTLLETAHRDDCFVRPFFEITNDTDTLVLAE